MELVTAARYCNAVDKNGEGIIDPWAHLTCYKVRTPVSTIQPEVVSTDQFGQLNLKLKRQRTELCVPSQEVGQDSALEIQGGATFTPTATPTATSSATPSVTPTFTPTAEPTSQSLDHFELYSVSQVPGTQRFDKRDVNLEDQFLDETVEVVRPTQLGVPTDKNEEGIGDPDSHLTCYAIRAPQFDKREVQLQNQFGQLRLTLRRPNMLCVPSDKQVVSEEG